MPTLNLAQLKKIGTARSWNTEYDDQEVPGDAQDRHALEEDVFIRADRRESGVAFTVSAASSAQMSAREKHALERRIWPGTLLFDYLVPPMRDTLLELVSGRRVLINVLKLFAAIVIIAAIIVAAFYFPPLVAFFAANALTSAAAIGVISTLVVSAVWLANEAVGLIEKFAQSRRWSPYECLRTQVAFWKGKHGIEEETLQKMNAYLVNKAQHVHSEAFKVKINQVIGKFQRSSRDEEGVHETCVFFAHELNSLMKSRSTYPDYLKDGPDLSTEEGRAESKQIKEQLDADIKDLQSIINLLRAAPDLLIETRKVLGDVYVNSLKENWKNEVKNLSNSLSSDVKITEPLGGDVKMVASPPPIIQPRTRIEARYHHLQGDLGKLSVDEDGKKIILKLRDDVKIPLTKEEYREVAECFDKMDQYKQKFPNNEKGEQIRYVEELPEVRAALKSPRP